MTLLITILSGVTVFVLGQIVQRLFIEPIQEQRRVIGKIAHAVLFYCNTSGDPVLASPATPEEALKAVRGLAAELHATLAVVPFYGTCARLRLVWKAETVREACRLLVGISNSYGRSEHKSEFEKELIILLKLAKHY